MARIHALPSIEVIRGLKGIIDFYLWKGLPCARAWPRWRPSRQSEASKAAALFFGAVVKSYSLLGDLPLAAYREDAAGQPRSPRDVFVSGIYGNLHEADVSDFLGLLIECRDFLSALTALLGALNSIDTDELVVNVDKTVLPPLAATTTNQAPMIAALQKLDDLQDALQSKHLDRFLVRGMDQLFTFADVLVDYRIFEISGADGYGHSTACPEGQIWCVTGIAGAEQHGATTLHQFVLHHDGTEYPFAENQAAFPADKLSYWQGLKWLTPGDTIRIYFIGGAAGHGTETYLTGYITTLET